MATKPTTDANIGTVRTSLNSVTVRPIANGLNQKTASETADKTKSRLGLGLKISLTFATAALIFGLVIIPAIGELDNLRRLQLESQQRSAAVRALLEMNILNRDEANALAELLQQNNRQTTAQVTAFQQAAAAKKVWKDAARDFVTKPQEQAWFAQLDEADRSFEKNFSEFLLPAYRSGDPSRLNQYTIQSDGYLNRIVTLSEQIISSYLQSETAAFSRANEQSNNTFFQLVFFSSVGIILHIGLIFVITRSILRPLKQLRNSTRRIAEGNLQAQFLVTTNDEVGDLAEDFNYMVQRLRQIMSQVQHESDQIQVSSLEISASSHAQVNGSGRQLQAVSKISTMVTQLNNNAKEIAMAAKLVSQAAQDTFTSTQVGQGAMDKIQLSLEAIRDQANDTAAKITRLNDSLNEASRIIELINQIADETHMLAVNATIEASDAGVHGQRFAVIAREVNDLAVRSGRAALVVAKIVQDVRGGGLSSIMAAQQNVAEVERSAAQIEDSERIIGEIVRLADRLVQLSKAISQATDQQQEASGQSVTMVQEIGQVAEANSLSSSLIAKAADELNVIARQLQDATTSLNLHTPARLELLPGESEGT